MTDVVKTIPVWLRFARAYARASNPVGFIVRSFIAKLGASGGIVRFAPGGLCIDVGAGTAPYRQDIEKSLKVGQYVAFDIAASDTTNVAGNAMRMPFRDGCARLITSFDVIQHIPDSGAVFSELARVLAPGGILVLTFPFNYCECDVLDFRRWTMAGMERDLEERGLEVLSMEQRGGRLFAFACALNWAAQHLVPGQRQGWRAKRTPAGILRAASLHLLTIPTTALQWIMLGLDWLLPNKGCYMGGIAVAAKPIAKTALPDESE